MKRMVKYFILLFVLIVVSISLWINITYSPDSIALNYTIDTEKVDVTENDFGLNFIPFDNCSQNAI